MRFAFISTMHDWPWGGSEELWSQTAIRLKQSRHQVYASVGFRPHLPSQILGLIETRVFRVKLHASHWAGVPSPHLESSLRGLTKDAMPHSVTSVPTLL